MTDEFHIRGHGDGKSVVIENPAALAEAILQIAEAFQALADQLEVVSNEQRHG